MIIDVREIPEEGLRLQGEITRDIFELDDQAARNEGPVQYDLHAALVSDSVLVRGSVSTCFQVECVRCLDRIPLKIQLSECVFHLPLEGEGSIDLTESIREDILLALPVYPHCEDGTPTRQCPLNGQFEKSDGQVQEEGTSEEPPQGRNTWSSLEDFDPPS